VELYDEQLAREPFAAGLFTDAMLHGNLFNVY